MKKIVTTVGAALLGLSGVSAYAGEIPVDLFTTGQAELEDTTLADGGLSSSVSTVGDDILGSERDLFVELLSQSIIGAGDARINVVGGVLNFSVDSGATGTGTVQWDGADGSPTLDHTGLGGLDFSGYDSFEVTTVFSDLGWEFVVGAYTDAANWTEISFSATAVPFSLPGVVSLISLAGFDNAALCGAVAPVPGVNSITCGSANTAPVNWANLGAIQFIIDPNGGTVALDVSVNSIRAVPVPSTLATFGLGLMIAGLMYRRRESSAS